MFKNRFHFWWVAISICLVTFIIRAPFTGFNSIITEIQKTYEFGETAKGIILSLPTFVMAILSAFVAKVDRKFGVVLSIFLAVALIVIGLFFRDVFTVVLGSFGIIAVYLGTLLLSFGITILNVLYPTFLNTFFSKQIGVMASINGTNLSISALSGTYSATMMINMGYSWHTVGIFWLLITLFVLLFFIPCFKFAKVKVQETINGTAEQVITENQAETTVIESELTVPRKRKARSMWLQIPAWALALALGAESANFYFVISWFYDLAKDSITIGQFAFISTLFQITSLPTSFYAPVFLTKYPHRANSVLFIVSVIFALATISMLYIHNFYFVCFAAIVFGVTAGLLISAYMTLISLKTTKTEATSQLSAMTQSVAFMMTSVVIFLIGHLVDSTGSFVVACQVIVAYNIIMPFFTYLASAMKIKE